MFIPILPTCFSRTEPKKKKKWSMEKDYRQAVNPSG